MAEKKRRPAGWKLRRIGPRALQTLERHKASDPVLAAFETTLIPAVQRHLSLYGQTPAAISDRAQSSERRASAVTKLHERTRSWLEPLSLHVHGLSKGDLAAAANVPDDVIAAARGVLAVVANRAATEPALPFAEALIADLTSVIAEAEAETGGVAGSLSDEQAHAEALRRAAAELHAVLVVFRRSVRRVLGANHPDCRRLYIRTRRKDEVLADEDLNEESDAADVAATDGTPLVHAATSATNGTQRN